MKPSEIARELLVPVTSPQVLLTIILFFGLFQIVMLAKVFGIVIAAVLAAQLVIFVLPALLRYLMIVLEARAFNREPEALDIELFPWIGNLWTLFPIVHVGAFAYLVYMSGANYGDQAALAAALIYAFVLPASLITLGITHSALESLHPLTLFELIKRRGFGYLVAPAFVVGATWLVRSIYAEMGSGLLMQFVTLYLIFAAFALFGGLARALQPAREIDIPLPASIDEEREREEHLISRTSVLNHAYGIISRGDRAKGLDHIIKALAEDPNEEAGWAWFFENMLRWENPEAGLAFGQHYVHELLRYGEHVKAVKVMLRCRLINEAFKPLPEDIELAIHAAEQCRNYELASFLR